MRHARWPVLAAAIGAIAALLVSPPKGLGLVVNLSASVAPGLYAITASPPTTGDLILVAPPPSVRELIHRRGYLRPGRPLLKILAAGPGSRVCRLGARVWVSGYGSVWARRTDSAGRGLPTWSGCRVLGGNEVFVLGTHFLSFDSRYFGPISRSLILFSLRPLLRFHPH